MVHTGEAQLEPCVSESVSRSPETVQTSLNQTPSRKQSPVCRTVSPACTATSSEGRGPQTPSTEPVKKSGKPWPRIYRLPKENIPRSVREKLDCGQEIGNRDRSLLLDAIYNEATQYNGGLYPTSEMYDNMVDLLFRDYAYLLTMGGLPSKSAREFWKDKLVFKFSNARKRIDKNQPEVISRSKTKTNKNPQPQTEDSSVFVWGLARFLPPLLVSEDSISQQGHIDWLKREHKKTISDIDISTINMKMDLTFSYRRKQIVEDKVGVKELIDMFPWLQSRQEILKEFQRLKPNTPLDDLEELFTIGLKKYREAIMKLLNGKKKPGYLTEIESVRAYFRIESQRDFADECTAIISLLILLKEKPEKVICFKDAAKPDSTIIINVKDKLLSVDKCAFEVVIEGVTIFECENFIEAISSIIGCIYTFNLAYPKPWEKFFTFIQNVIIGLKDDEGRVNLDRRILTVLSSINSELSKA
ncbi:unnamed protein product [Mytilus coruscus]|uniref:Uncharacterized protein n=1 Tax=Mytilus coruscus TaxID=42192 RepID=A0A6J8F0F7_MYTCO|nr:unnamed protein product [Mytilus coruscus]